MSDNEKFKFSLVLHNIILQIFTFLHLKNVIIYLSISHFHELFFSYIWKHRNKGLYTRYPASIPPSLESVMSPGRYTSRPRCCTQASRWTVTGAASRTFWRLCPNTPSTPSTSGFQTHRRLSSLMHPPWTSLRISHLRRGSQTRKNHRTSGRTTEWVWSVRLL